MALFSAAKILNGVAQRSPRLGRVANGLRFNYRYNSSRVSKVEFSRRVAEMYRQLLQPKLPTVWIFVICSGLAITGGDSAASETTSNQSLPAETPSEYTTTDAKITRRFEIYNPHSREQLQTVKDMGFTQVILDWPNLHADASDVGLDVVMANWWTDKSEAAQVEKGMETALQVDRRRLQAVSMMDEPERHSPDTPFSFYQALYQDLRAHLDKDRPEVQLEISHWGPLRSWPPELYEAFVPLYQATDRIRLMPYPDLGEGPLSEVYLQMLRSRRIMKQAERSLPQIVILQTWVLPEDPKLPTIDELRVMSYQALLGGAHTVSYYNYDPTTWSKTPGFTEGFAGLIRELSEFSRRHQGATADSQLRPNGLLEATIRSSDGSTVSVVVNTNRSETDGVPALSVTESSRTTAPPSPGQILPIGSEIQGSPGIACQIGWPCEPPDSCSPCPFDSARVACTNAAPVGRTRRNSAGDFGRRFGHSLITRRIRCR